MAVVSCPHVGRNYVDVIDNHQDGIGEGSTSCRGEMKYVTKKHELSLIWQKLQATPHFRLEVHVGKKKNK